MVVGNKGITVDQARVQMAIWAILAVPLLISTDLDIIMPEFKEILLDKDVIAISQCKLGKQGTRIYTRDGLVGAFVTKIHKLTDLLKII